MANTPKNWDDKQGQPKDEKAKRAMHDAHERYSASKDKPPKSDRPPAKEPKAGDSAPEAKEKGPSR